MTCQTASSGKINENAQKTQLLRFVLVYVLGLSGLLLLVCL